MSASMFNIQIENPHEHVDDGKTVAAMGVGEVKLTIYVFLLRCNGYILIVIRD